MKATNTLKMLFQMVLFSMIVLTTSSTLYGQELKSTSLAEFEIIAERTEKTIKLTCITGCAWKNLSYKPTMYKPVSIDELGMATLNQTSVDKNNDVSRFLFNLVVTETAIQLEGKEGLAWKKLGFTLGMNARQSFSQDGMN